MESQAIATAGLRPEFPRLDIPPPPFQEHIELGLHPIQKSTFLSRQKAKYAPSLDLDSGAFFRGERGGLDGAGFSKVVWVESAWSEVF